MALWGLALLTGALLLASGLVAAGFEAEFSIPVAAVALVAFITERQSVRLSPTLEISVSFLPFIFAAVVFGPLPAMLVGVVSLGGQFGKRFDTDPSPWSPHVRWVVWSSSRALVCGAAGLAAVAAGGSSARSFASIFAAVTAASMTEVLCDLAFGALTVTIRRSGSLREQIRMTSPVLLAAVPLYTPVAAVLIFTYREFSPWSVALFVIPAFAAHRLFALYRGQRDAAEGLAAAIGRLERANLSFATALVATLDARDEYTAGHSAAVAVYAEDIARRMGLSEDEQRLARLCGLVHDIGKVGLPPGLLEKRGPLSLDERRQMEQHSAIGERILRKVEDYAEIARIVRHHHERVDGQGYPDRLDGSEIPLLSQIIAVADAYNAMTSDRPYRDAMPSRVARLRLAQAVESQFDTSIVAAFEAILASGSEEYRSGQQLGPRGHESSYARETLRAVAV